MLLLEKYDDIVDAINGLRNDGTAAWVPATIAAVGGVVVGWGLSSVTSIWNRREKLKDEDRKKRESAVNAVSPHLLWFSEAIGSRSSTVEWDRHMGNLKDGEALFHTTGKRADGVLGYSFASFRKKLVDEVYAPDASVNMHGNLIPREWDAHDRREFYRGQVSRVLNGADEWVKGDSDTKSLVLEIDASCELIENKIAEAAAASA